jgi:hypothetical protein
VLGTDVTHLPHECTNHQHARTLLGDRSRRPLLEDPVTLALARLAEAADGLPAAFCDVEALAERFAGLLAPEDQVRQSMPDGSLAKWHRANTTWFYEGGRLGADPGDRPHDPSFLAGDDAIGLAVPRPTVFRSPSRQPR